MRLLELPEELQHWIRDGHISAGHARALLPLGDARQQFEFARRIRDEQISVRATEQMVQETIAREDGMRQAEATSRGRTRTRNSHIASLERELRSLLGVKVDIKAGARGNGRLVIHFRDSEEFDHIRQILMDGATREPQAKAG